MLKFERLELNLAEWQHTLSRFADRAIVQTSALLQFIASTQTKDLVLAALYEWWKCCWLFYGCGTSALQSPAEDTSFITKSCSWHEMADFRVIAMEAEEYPASALWSALFFDMRGLICAREVSS